MLGIHLHLSGGKVHEIWINNSQDSRAALGHVVTEYLKMYYKYGRPSCSGQLFRVEAISMVDVRPCFKLEEGSVDLHGLHNNFLTKVNNAYSII